MAMKFGLFSINAYACTAPEGAMRVARAAEAAGFESLWGGEHVVLPDPQAPPSPMAPGELILDPLISLAYCAAVTSKVRLGTGIIILPQRNPLVLAKQLASIDALSGGRLIAGLGVGYLEAEFRALGAPFEDRGRVTDEYLAARRPLSGAPCSRATAGTGSRSMPTARSARWMACARRRRASRGPRRSERSRSAS